MKHRIILTVMATLVVLAAAPVKADETFSDLPADSWAAADIGYATAAGLMDGMGNGRFGYGEEVTRAQFVALICRMMGWEPVEPTAGAYSDVPVDNWYSTYVETALRHGALDGQGGFRPSEPITREEMAVMLVRALGYGTLADQVAGYGTAFSDVTAQAGAIAIARDIGMVRGSGDGRFLPDHTAKREEAAAMLVRIHKKRASGTGWVHAFYAHSSYEQRHLAAGMDAVSFGWSAMEWDRDSGARLNTNAAGGNEWHIPEGYALITGYLDGTKTHLSVFMNTAQSATAADGTGSNSLRELLRTPEGRAQAVEAIVAEVTRLYDNGRSPYSGVTVDFEGLTHPDRDNYTTFLSELSDQLKARAMTLYVAVHAALPDGRYYDGYDYRAVGELADRVILMAHDYSPQNLDSYIGTRWHENTPVTPFSQVYYALRAITDEQTGVADPGKIALALSFSPVAWAVDAQGRLVSGAPIYPTSERVSERMRQPDSMLSYSNATRNAVLRYTAGEGEWIYLWYEDSRSLEDKLALARLFGVTGVSIWRLGLIPAYEGYDVSGAFS